MDIKLIENVATSQAVWAIIAIAGGVLVFKALKVYITELRKENAKREEELMAFYKEEKTESKERENRLMIHLEKTTVTLSDMSESLAKVQKDIENVHNRIDRLAGGN